MSIISFSQFQSKYRFDCQLSQGSFGRVCRIQQIESKKYFALKKVMVKKKQQLEDIQNEIRLLYRFKHPFIVQIRESYNIQIKNGFAKPIWEVGIVMELAKCSIQQLIKQKKHIGTYQFILQQTAGLIRILFILQQQNIAHRDIKPANILVFEAADNSYRWKLADFGLAVDLSGIKEEENFAGSFQYASPKLKRKFKYPNLKIKTNSFKDDVYSLGVSLLQTITGLRSYNNVAYQKLRQLCSEKKLVNIIDMMLEQDEQKRPCFKQLMILIQKDFRDYIRDVETENMKQLNELYKKNSSFQERYEEMSERTIIKKYSNNVKKTILQVGKPIQAIINLEGVTMCGCQNGQILFVRDGQVINGGKIHSRNVSQFFSDSKGNIWSIGGDCTAKIWNKKQLLKGLENDVRQIQQIKYKMFSKPQQVSLLVLQIKQSYYRTINFPLNKICGVSTFFGLDENNFGVGFYDGHVYIKWNGNQYNYHLFSKPITSIKLSKNKCRFWLCSLDGSVKCIQTEDLMLMNRFFYKKGSPIIDLYLHQQADEEYASLMTLTNGQIILNKNLQCIFENRMPAKRILSAVRTQKNCYMLSDSGQIIDLNEEKIVQLNFKGWNCLALLGDQDVVAGSFSGALAWISW